jgi:hypothetical protein
MKISSPFAEYIPDCKKNMRRLRKKIYKFITSKNYHRRQQTGSDDLMSVLSLRQIPQIVVDQLAKRKTIDLSAIRNLNIPVRLPLKQIAEITAAQEQEVGWLQEQWLRNSLTRRRLKSYDLEGLRERESSSKRTLSSTEFEYDEEDELREGSCDVFLEGDSGGQNNLNQDIEFHHFARGNSFL